MKILELFSGTESFSKVARGRGHECFTIENDTQFNPSLCKDILEITINDIPFKPDIIWASPPCQKFSVATIGRNWNKDKTPKTDGAKDSIRLIEKTLELIKELNPKYWFIENPRAMLRTLPVMKNLPRKTVTYCQYGEKYMKPTDIWTNLNWDGKKCKNGMSCHESAPRGSKKGVQGLKDATQRGRVPRKLCEEIIEQIENETNNKI